MSGEVHRHALAPEPIGVPRAPKVLDMEYVARRWGWTVRRARETLIAEKLVWKMGPGRGVWVTTRARVREKFPYLADLL